MSEIAPGKRLFSAVSSTEVIVVRAPAATDPPEDLSCGGTAMTTATNGVPRTSTDGPTVELGKRYVDDTSGLEVLCTKAGAGPLAFAGRQLTLKTAKPLPASD